MRLFLFYLTQFSKDKSIWEKNYLDNCVIKKWD